MGHWEWGIGHGAMGFWILDFGFWIGNWELGMGHGAWGMGHGAWGIGKKEDLRKTVSKFPCVGARHCRALLDVASMRKFKSSVSASNAPPNHSFGHSGALRRTKGEVSGKPSSLMRLTHPTSAGQTTTGRGEWQASPYDM
jgi:hypothetical protein